MRLNEHQAVLSPKILLVPYSEHHVPTYHEWMQDEALQEATASEPLTLPEEYAMQKSWRTDPDKLTFIVCVAPHTAGANESAHLVLERGKQDAPSCMLGDVNLFLYPDVADDEEDPDVAADANGVKSGQPIHDVIGEVEIMIAGQHHQGKGLGKQILLTFLWYITSNLTEILGEYRKAHTSGKAETVLKYLRVKINSENARSVRLFESAGFDKVSDTPNYFGELELRRSISADHIDDIVRELGAIPLSLAYP
ncbi:uncharacterized protein EI97DRAFT_8890 [Westerdykella ornata]|uniref:N-acetyltransferase domain-containing protein n=1 Tax=Westerdykella ornata TaxID=318751 RepID=A0A6A6JXL8_WESOR|nr:uncharacterized protein EI97DRAFT_8890 [Westerdykella ornata]KAF2280813.1 hypothetical protein EI97DRAFT_8890 [Westerdykella ornata]